MQSGAASSGGNRSKHRVNPAAICGNTWSFPNDSKQKKYGPLTCWRKIPSTRERPCMTCSTPTVKLTSSASRKRRALMHTRGPTTPTTKQTPLATTFKRAYLKSTAGLASAKARTWASSISTTKPGDCAGRWSMERKPCGATVRALTPTSRRVKR